MKKDIYLNLVSLDKGSWKGIKITKNAIKQIAFLSSRNNKILGLRLNIKKSGCAGFIYVMEWVKIENKNDIHFSYGQETNLYIPISSMPYLDGIKIDYVKDGLNRVFKFKNPKSKKICGCGESFGVD